MSRERIAPRVIGAASVVIIAGVSLGACGDARDSFVESQNGFVVDASVDAPDCGIRCSLDGRAIVNSCTGETVQTCPPELACGDGACIEPCQAAAVNRSSNGCEFYFQPLRFPRQEACYASYIVNPSTVPVDVSLELEGAQLDISKSMYRMEPGAAKLTPHTGPIPPGESTVLFLADVPPDVAVGIRANASLINADTTCPPGVVPVVVSNRAFRMVSQMGTSFHLTSTAPVSLATIFPFGGARSFFPSATLVLPVAGWSRENMIVNGWDGFNGPSAQVVAAADDTEVTILPTVEVQDGEGVKGGPARRPLKYRLNRGQFLQLTQGEELTGSRVSSTKPTAMFGGHTCALVPEQATACDTLQQHIPPPEQWGSEYVGVGYRPRLDNEGEPVPYRIVAARDATQLDYDPAIPPGAPTALNAGEVATFRTGTGNAFVVRTQDADHPVYVAAYMTGANGGGFAPATQTGDPEFVNVVPAGQYLNAYSFYADPTYVETSLVIVRKKTLGEFKDVWLECAGNLSAAKGEGDIGFRPIGTRGEYEFVRVDLARRGGPGDKFGTSVCTKGLQRLRSEGPFTATVWGWSYCASYAYPGGMALRPLAKPIAN